MLRVRQRQRRSCDGVSRGDVAFGHTVSVEVYCFSVRIHRVPVRIYSRSCISDWRLVSYTCSWVGCVGSGESRGWVIHVATKCDLDAMILVVDCTVCTNSRVGGYLSLSGVEARYIIVVLRLHALVEADNSSPS